jgi:hypothetical protein
MVLNTSKDSTVKEIGYRLIKPRHCRAEEIGGLILKKLGS